MTTETSPYVLTAIEGARGAITLDRPAALNALTLPMIRAVRAALGAFEDDPGVRVITIDSTRWSCSVIGCDPSIRTTHTSAASMALCVRTDA